MKPLMLHLSSSAKELRKKVVASLKQKPNNTLKSSRVKIRYFKVQSPAHQFENGLVDVLFHIIEYTFF